MNSLFARTLILAALEVTIVLMLVGGSLWWLQTRITNDALERHLLAYTDLLIPAVEWHNNRLRLADDASSLRAIPRQWRLSSNGELIAASNPLAGSAPSANRLTSENSLTSFADGSQLAIRKRYEFPGASGPVSVDAVFAMPKSLADQHVEAATAELRGALTALFFAACAIALTAASLRVWWLMAPIQRIKQDLAAIRSGSESTLAANYPSEIQALADEINQLLANNQSLLTRHRNFNANLAHAIRTPLTTLLNSSDLREIRDKAMLVNTLLARNLVRADAGGNAAADRVQQPLGPLVEKICRNYAKQYGKTCGVQLAPNTLQLRGDENDFYELLGNLVENACQHATSRIEVAAEPGRISINDDGPGAPAHKIDQLLERGVRADENPNSGMGIGLAIVRELATTLGGSLALEHSKLGGLQATLRLPQLVPCDNDGAGTR